jgi:hypothetical protein
MLKLLLSGRLKNTRIDLPFQLGESINLSIDVKLELKNPDSINIYEIKTGDNFKQDKIAELKKTLEHLYLYEELIELNCQKFIIISPEVKSEILEHWNDFLLIKAGKKMSVSHSEPQKDIQKRVFASFGFGDKGVSQDKFINFIKQITFNVGPSYKNDSDNDKLTDIEDQIKSEIDNFCTKVSLNNSEIEIPSWTIALELLEVLNRCVENNKDILEDFIEKLNDCLCRKRILKEAVYSKDKNKILDEVRDEIRNEIINITKLNFEEDVKLIQ